MAERQGKSGTQRKSGGRSKGKAGGAKRTAPARKRSTQAKRSTPAKRSTAVDSRNAERGAVVYAREAVTEWGKAARYAAAALRDPDGPSLKDRLNPATGTGGRLGDAADRLLSKLGPPGKVAAKLGAGRRMVRRLGGGLPNRDGGDGASPNGDEGWDDELPIPIQQAMEVAVSPKTAYELCLRFGDYPEFLDRVQDVEDADESGAVLHVTVRGVRRRIEIEILDARPGRRIDWEATGDLPHSGVISFHELAPSLTHVELSIDLEPHGIVERIARFAHLTDRAVHAEMQRFKAYAELWQEEEPEDSEPEEEPEEEEFDEDEASGEREDEDEEEFEEEYEEEPEPAAAG
jgi:uncharacterized membrane protein